MFHAKAVLCGAGACLPRASAGEAGLRQCAPGRLTCNMSRCSGGGA